MSGTRTWRLRDIVDLEVLLFLDRESDPGALAERDRRIYRDAADAGTPARRRPQPDAAVRRWIAARRRESATPLPGRTVERVARLLAAGLLLTGLASGLALGWGVLAYTGEHGINLFIAAAVLVGLPLLGALLSLAAMVLHPARVLTGITGFLWNRAVPAALARRLDPGGRRRADRAALAGRLRAGSTRYAGLIRWRVAALTQWLGLGFALGLALACVTRGWVSDLAFCWHTTAEVRPAQLHGIACAVAAPWRPLLPAGLACPSVAEVAGSRVDLTLGVGVLDPAARRAWWPWLCLGSVTYGLLPRLALLAAALAGGLVARCRLRVRTAEFNALFRRMTMPTVLFRRPAAEAAHGLPQDAATGTPPPGPAAGTWTLVPRDLNDTAARARVVEGVRARFGAAPDDIREAAFDEDADDELLATLRPPGGAGLLLVQESRQPCLTETLDYIRAWRTALGPDPLIFVGLLGHADRSIRAAELAAWRSRLDTLADPCVGLVSLEDEHPAGGENEAATS